MKKLLIGGGIIIFVIITAIIIKMVIKNTTDSDMNDGTEQYPEITFEGTGSADMVEKEPASYTLEEIATHKSKNDCWFIINDKVYDVTNFVNYHPGGEIIVEGCGIDATSLFEKKPGSGLPHSSDAIDAIGAYYIGNLKQ